MNENSVILSLFWFLGSSVSWFYGCIIILLDFAAISALFLLR